MFIKGWYSVSRGEEWKTLSERRTKLAHFVAQTYLLLLLVAVPLPLSPPPAQKINLGRNFSYYIRKGTVRISTGTSPYFGIFVVFLSAST
jgi:hypothetical protein